MFLRDGTVVFSPSDLNVFFESPFASWMDRLRVERPREAPAPEERSEEMSLAAEMGNAHEAAHLARLRAERRDVWGPPRESAPRTDPFAATAAAMRAGHEIIFQAALRDDGFEGHADFLYRVDGASELGDFHYEVADTKLARKPKPYFLLQLSAYTEMVAALQGRRGSSVHVIGGDGVTSAFRTDDFYFFYLAQKRAFLAMQAAFHPKRQPLPAARADHRRWQAEADRILDELDHPSRTARITTGQIARLAAVGITTRTALASTKLRHVARLDDAVFDRLRRQAKLQVMSVDHERPRHELIACTGAAEGLALLPPPTSADVFFDMEGYPFAEGGLEYLFGAVVHDRARQFHDFWAHDRPGEKRAFEAFVDWVHARFVREPRMHVYHYAPYEVTALRRLMGAHGTRERQVDELLRAEVFVDLYQIVRQALRIGEPRYSLKNVERLYRDARSGDVASGGESIVQYARWREAPDGGDWRTSRILADIRTYNEEDCVSTRDLAAWLRARQTEAGVRWVAPTKRGAEAPPDAPGVGPVREDELLAERLLAQAPAEGSRERSADPERWRVHELLAHLATFHRRESKPFFWKRFDGLKKTAEELREDDESLGDLCRTAAPQVADKRSVLYEYAFAPQETKVAEGDSCTVVPGGATTSVHKLDLLAGTATLRCGAGKEPPPDRLSLLSGEYVKPAPIPAAIARVAESFADAGKLPGALRCLLMREPPRITGHKAGAPLLAEGEDVLAGTVRVIRAMRGTTLAVQGPPGAGKTTTAAHAIVALVRDGKRVGVTSNSHAAINRLLEDVIVLAREGRKAVRVTKVARHDDEIVTRHGAARADSMRHVAWDEPQAPQVVGGTAWAFADPSAEGCFDHLFVDEAGQVCLANVVGMAASARNLVLLGDPMQLPQPTQAVHPGESGASALGYLFGGAATVPPERGIFLARTWRLHPDLCTFVSGAFYEDRLQPEPCTAKRHLVPRGVGDPSAGIYFVPVPHEGNTQASVEECEKIATLVADLEQRKLMTDLGRARRLTRDDILVVAPYNLQVRHLRKRLPCMRVGTVDRFQGQQAPVVIVSMCASSDEGVTRGIDFLLNPNRLNVAISRAQCLALVVGSPALSTCRVTTVANMRLVNLFCRVVAAAPRGPGR